MEAPAVTKVIAEGRGPNAVHFAEVTVFLDTGDQTRLRGPARRNRQEALRDCVELRTAGMKSASDPALFKVRQKAKELESTTWTVKDLARRMLDGAEGPPPGFVVPRTSCPDPARTASAPQKAAGPSQVVEVTDVRDCVPGASGDAWTSRAKVALQQAFKRFGPVLEVRLDGGEGGEEIASVRFASAKAAEAAMAKARQGFLQVGAAHVRVRQPSAAEAVWRRFPAKRGGPAIEAPPSKKKLRPNERFAARLPAAGEEEPDESERFWDSQAGSRGKPAEPLPSAAPPEPPPPEPEPVPEKPVPSACSPDGLEEDREVCKGEEEVAREMSAILERPFSQQRKALKALRLRWHPDKNPEREEVATRVFQFIQAHDAWLAHRDLA